MNELALTDGESTGDTYYMMYYYNLDEKPVRDDFLHHRALRPCGLLFTRLESQTRGGKGRSA